MLSGDGGNGSATAEALVTAYYCWFDPSSAHLRGLRSVRIYEESNFVTNTTVGCRP